MENTFAQQFAGGEQFSPPMPVQRQRRSVPRFIFLLLILLFFAAIGFGVIRFFGLNQTKNTPAIITPTPTPDVFPTDTPAITPLPSTSPNLSPSPTTIPTINPVDKATGLDRSDLSVSVQNGSGIVGAASKMSEVLKSFGYHVISVGNADSYNYEQVTIAVKSSASKFLPLLKIDVAKQFTIASSSATLSASSSADALVIVGK